MSDADELCALGFERYWVSQALELTNHNKDYALEWLLSDEFKLARDQFNEQKKKFKDKQTADAALPETVTSTAHTQSPQNGAGVGNPLLLDEVAHHDAFGHNKDPSLQQMHGKSKPMHASAPPPPEQDEVEVEFDPNAPELKPTHTITDYKKIGIDHLLDDDDDSSDSDLVAAAPAGGAGGAPSSAAAVAADGGGLGLLPPASGRIERSSSAIMDDENAVDAQEEDVDMQSFLQKLKNQVNVAGDWLCHQCGVEVKGELSACHMCHSVRRKASDWICNVCTFVNGETEAVCHMCLHEPAPAHAKALREKRISLQPQRTWSCASCGYHNSKTKCCRMCGYVLGDQVTPQQAQQGDSDGDGEEQDQQRIAKTVTMADDDDDEEDLLMQLAKGNARPKVDIAASGVGAGAGAGAGRNMYGDDPLSPSKHVSAKSAGDEDDVFGDLMASSWNGNGNENGNEQKQKQKPKIAASASAVGGGGGAMVMVQRQKKHKKVEDEDDEEDEEEDEEEEEENMDVVIPMMDEEVLRTQTDPDDAVPVPLSSSSAAVAAAAQVEAPSAAAEAVPELSGMELLKSMYAKDESASKKKIKLKLRVGAVVDIYSSTRQDWTEGIIKEIKGDLLCIVYGKHMKWLKKNSRQLRPKAHDVEQALALKQDEPVVVPEPAMEAAVAAEQEPEFQPPPPCEPPPAFAMGDNDDLHVPMAPDHFGTPKQPVQVQPPPPVHAELAQREARPDEFDYDVTFTTSVLGLELYPDKNGQNCIVGKCLSKTSKKFVDPSSMVLAVNDLWVCGMSYDMVRDAIKQAAKYPPLKMQFRVKMNSIGKRDQNGGGDAAGGVNERGYLKVKVVAGVQLKHRASYCVVQVGNARLSTREVPRDEHPEWQEMLTFKNFRPDAGKQAIVTVYDHSTILKDKKIGSATYEIPVAFNKLQRDTLELKNSKGKLSGVIILNTIIVHKSNSIRHRIKY